MARSLIGRDQQAGSAHRGSRPASAGGPRYDLVRTGDVRGDGPDAAPDVSPNDAAGDEGAGIQDPIPFVVRNVSDATLFFDYSLGANNVIDGAKTTGGAWAGIGYFPPPALVDCARVDPGSHCCVMFDVVAAVRQISPGQELRITWSGGNVFEGDDRYCQCPCHRAADVIP